MDNDNEITNSIVEARRFFLSQNIDDDTSQEYYDLEEEFAKTSKKRPKVVPLVLLAVLAVSYGIAHLTVVLLDLFKPSNPAVVDNFQELRLREILNTARRNEQALANQERDLRAIIAERDAAIEQVRSDTQAALALLGQRLISNAERNRQRNQILQRERQNIAQIENDYSARIAEKEAEIERIRKEVESYQARLTDQDRRQQAIIASSEAVAEIKANSLQSSYQRQLEQLQSQSRETLQAERAFHEEYVRLTEEKHAEEIRQLILLYNPIIQDDEAASILSMELPEPIQERQPYPELLTREKLWSIEGYQNLWEGMQRVEVLRNRLKEVPYENSIPVLLEQWRRQNWATFAEFEDLWAQLVEGIKSKNQIIAEKDQEIADRNAEIELRDRRIEELKDEIRTWQRTLTAVADAVDSFGFIAVVVEPQRFRVWPSSSATFNPGQRAQVFSENTLIGVVELKSENGQVWATTISIERPARPVRVLDRLKLLPEEPAP